jgi:hypothetical protein
MRVLVLAEVQDLDVPRPVDLVPQDEAVCRELAEQWLHRLAIEGEELGLNALRPVFEPAFAIGHHPEPGEDVACPNGALGEVFVGIEARLDVATSGHQYLR